MGLPNTTYIDAYINDGQQAVLSLRNFYDTILVSNANRADHIYRVPMADFFVKHRDQLSGIVRYYSVPETMFYKPKLVSYELYDTTELWLSLLRLNDMRNTTEFHMPIIKVYEASALKELINIFFKREGKTS